jgi:hypothetical protein
VIQELKLDIDRRDAPNSTPKHVAGAKDPHQKAYR